MNRTLKILVTSLTIVLSLSIIIFVANGNNAQSQLLKLKVNPMGTVGAPFITEKININTTFKKPEKFKVYQVKNLSIKKVDIEDLAKSLEIKGEIKEKEKSFELLTNDKKLMVDKTSGSLTYTTNEWESNSNPLKFIKKDQDYIDIATKFLNDKNLMRKEAKFFRVKQDVKGVYNPQTDKYDETPYEKIVEFTRDLKGITWTGVGPKIDVYINDTGVIAVKSVWRDIEEVPVGDYPLINIEEAVSKLLKGEGLIYNNSENPEVAIDNIDIVYYNDSIAYDQKYLIPHYLLSGKDVKAIIRALPDDMVEEIPLPNNSNIGPIRK